MDGVTKQRLILMPWF